MFKSTKRADRRHHYNRLKNRRIDLNYWGRYGDQGMPKWTKPVLGMAVNTPCNCSCTMCGNPRRHFSETTLAEQRNKDSFEDLMLDYYISEI